MSSVKSKGKWLPGSKDARTSWSNFYCESCERDFSKSTSYERHLTTELHFKRTSADPHSSSSTRGICESYAEDPDFFEEIHIKNQKTRRNNATSASQFSITCPTCLANVEKRQMGKHLISHFHCQRTTTKGRLENPEKALILMHMQDIVIESPFQCGNCKFYFTQRNQLLNHFSKYHAKLEIRNWTQRNVSYGWSCSACIGICAMDIESLVKHLNGESHMKMEVAIAKSIPIIVRQLVLQSCTICGKKFKLHRPLLSHYKQQHQLVMYQEAEASSEPDMLSDMLLIVNQKNTNTDDKKYSTEEFRRSGEFPLPTSLAEPSGIALKVCALCSATFSSEGSLNRHVSHAHPIVNGYRCDQCSYCSKKRSHYIRHLKTHNPNRAKLYKCDKCEASFHEKYALTFHYKIHDGKPWKCDYLGCKVVGRSKVDIKDHSVTHQPSSSNRCEHCEYSTKSLKHLNRHMKLRHTESKDVRHFSCRYCPFKAKLKDGVKRHEKKHLNNQAFDCPYCDYKARDLELLRSHILKRNQHPGKFMYNCQICIKAGSKTFTSNLFQDFQLHIIQEHPDNAYRNSKSGIFTIAGLKKDHSKDVDLPEVSNMEGASGARCTHLHENQNFQQEHETISLETTTKKDLKSKSDENPSVLIHHIQSPQRETISGIEVEGQLIISQISDFTESTATSGGPVTTDSYDHHQGLTFGSA